MDIIHKNISGFFDELLANLNCQPDTRAYIVSIYGKYKTADFDLSQCSIGLQFCQAREKQDFLTYQNIGDWIFYAISMAPEHLKFASEDYYISIARLSYYSCYKITKKQWKCYEQLADDFIDLEEQVKKCLPKLNAQIFPGTYIGPYDS